MVISWPFYKSVEHSQKVVLTNFTGSDQESIANLYTFTYSIHNAPPYVLPSTVFLFSIHLYPLYLYTSTFHTLTKLHLFISLSHIHTLPAATTLSLTLTSFQCATTIIHYWNLTKNYLKPIFLAYLNRVYCSFHNFHVKLTAKWTVAILYCV